MLVFSMISEQAYFGNKDLLHSLNCERLFLSLDKWYLNICWSQILKLPIQAKMLKFHTGTYQLTD